MSLEQEETAKKKKPNQLQQKRARQKMELERLLFDIKLIEFNGVQTATEILEDHSILDRLAALPQAYDSEITLALCSQFQQHPATANDYKKTVRALRAELSASDDVGKKGKKSVRKGKIQDYFDLYETLLGRLKRDIFTGKLLYADEEGLWNPAINELGRLKSEGAVLEEEGVCKFSLGLYEPHLEALQSKKDKELIVNLPEWDGVDRIKTLAQACVLDGSQKEFTTETVEQFFKGWMATMYLRIFNPKIQNRILILKGPQGIGKDYIADVMTGHLGQWAKNLTITRNERDTLMQLSSAAVLKIAEFDRTSATDVGLLKHMVTAENTDLRASHAKDEKRRSCRCSFVATCNVEDIFRDSTGHRRYIVISLDNITRGYPDSAEDKAQVLAQAKHLASRRFKANKEAERVLFNYLEMNQPTSLEDDVVDAWKEAFLKFWKLCDDIMLMNRIKNRGWICNSEVAEAGLIRQVSTMVGISERKVQKKLGVMGWARRDITSRGYRVVLPLDDGGEHDAYEVAMTDDEVIL